MARKQGNAVEAKYSFRVTPRESYRAVRGVRRKYDEVRACLERHLSKILVDSVLHRAFESRGMTPEALTLPDLEVVVEDSMVGLRLFVPKDHLPRLMVELSEILTGD
jgi:hypothetical protein